MVQLSDSPAVRDVANDAEARMDKALLRLADAEHTRCGELTFGFEAANQPYPDAEARPSGRALSHLALQLG
ncbi:hypothetical protein [Arthrobacter sp. NPDC092385]|uniref:hypothetical protein n=1 Tax=Arthrobacter sp. NPDC092385 TaxID=3363943 RepID=UPI00382A5BC2